MVEETNKSILINMRKELIEKKAYETRLNKINCDIKKIQSSCRHEICVVLGKDELQLGYNKYIQDRKYCLCCGKHIDISKSIDIDMSNYGDITDEEKLTLIRNYYLYIIETNKDISISEVADMLNSYVNKTKEKVKLLEK